MSERTVVRVHVTLIDSDEQRRRAIGLAQLATLVVGRAPDVLVDATHSLRLVHQVAVKPRHLAGQLPARVILLAELPLLFRGEIDFPHFLVDEVLLAVLNAAIARVVGADGAEEDTDEGQFDDEGRGNEKVVEKTVFACRGRTRKYVSKQYSTLFPFFLPCIIDNDCLPVSSW